MSWLDKYFRTGMRNVAIGGTLLPAETIVNFVSGAVGVDNAAQGRSDVTVGVSSSAGILRVAIAGVALAGEPTINFVRGATGVDNSGSSRTDVSVSGYGWIRTVGIAGAGYPQESMLNFVSGATAVDNPAMGRTDIYLSSGGGIQQVAIGGATKPAEQILNFVSGFTAVDNPGSNRTDITPASGLLWGTSSITGSVAIHAPDSNSTMYSVSANSTGYTLSIDEASGVPRMVFFANTGTNSYSVQAVIGGSPSGSSVIVDAPTTFPHDTFGGAVVLFDGTGYHGIGFRL